MDDGVMNVERRMFPILNQLVPLGGSTGPEVISQALQFSVLHPGPAQLRSRHDGATLHIFWSRDVIDDRIAVAVVCDSSERRLVAGYVSKENIFRRQSGTYVNMEVACQFTFHQMGWVCLGF
jgi:hypothetical protein